MTFPIKQEASSNVSGVVVIGMCHMFLDVLLFGTVNRPNVLLLALSCLTVILALLKGIKSKRFGDMGQVELIKSNNF